MNCAKRIDRQSAADEDDDGTSSPGLGDRPVRRRKVTAAIAVKFLLARKFDVSRAVVLYEQHEQARHRDGLYDLDPRSSEKLKRELATGKFTILVSELIYIYVVPSE